MSPDKAIAKCLTEFNNWSNRLPVVYHHQSGRTTSGRVAGHKVADFNLKHSALIMVFNKINGVELTRTTTGSQLDASGA